MTGEMVIDNVTGVKKAYDKAVKDGAAMFKYKEHDFVTLYAKYFLEFWGPKYGIKP